MLRFGMVRDLDFLSLCGVTGITDSARGCVKNVKSLPLARWTIAV